MRDDLLKYYEGFTEREWQRLTRPADGALEFATTCHMLETNLPSAARVLDIGGGPGRYTLWLAERGHRVTLADLSPALLDVARAQIAMAENAGLIEDVVVADACDLGRWPDDTFDVVLCMGPFYHLLTAAERERAAQELARVLRPAGVAFIALIPRHAFLRRVIANPTEHHHLTAPAFLDRLLNEGVFLNDVPGAFPSGYGVDPPDVAPFFELFGLAPIRLIASEGIIPDADLQQTLADLAETDPNAYRAALNAILRTADDPSILGICTHLLYVARKTG